MIETATLLAALGVLTFSVQAIVQMSASTRLVVRVMYVVIACGSFATLVRATEVGCQPAGIADLTVWCGLLLMMVGQRRQAWTTRPALYGRRSTDQ